MKLSGKNFKRKYKLLPLVHYSGNKHRQLGPNLSFSRHHVEKVFNKYLDIPNIHKFFKNIVKRKSNISYICMLYAIHNISNKYDLEK